MKGKKTILLLVFTALIGASLFAIDATVVEKKGKVEFFQNGEWIPVRVNMKLDIGTMISTGFKSSAKLDLGDSIIAVSQLSRLKIEELSKKDNFTKTTLFLKVGKVKADVKSSAKLKHNFQFRSPVATASVRGTSFTFTPLRLTVHKGAVAFSNSFGQKGLIVKGQKAATDPNGGISGKKQLAKNFISPALTGEVPVGVEPESLESIPLGSVHITVTYE